MTTTMHTRPGYTRTSACTPWCDGHLPTDPDDNVEMHHSLVPELSFPELRNRVRGEVVRSGGGEVDLRVRSRGGMWPLIDVTVYDSERNVVELRITPGEARSLARKLETLADRIDLE